MRMVLAVATIGIVMSADMNSVPMRGAPSLESAATANPVPPEQLIAEAAGPADASAYAGQVAALGKADRLFILREPEASASSDTPLSEPAAAMAPEAPPELSTSEFCEALTEAAAESDIPPAFFARLIWQESKFRHDAQSPVGAQGVAQFMPRTAAEMGLDDPFDPRKALPASARFLRKLHDQFGNLGLAAAAYNAGSGRIQNWLARRGPLPEETRNYVRKVTGNIAEKWTVEKQTVALQVDLPREAPCDGVGGLSRDKDVKATRVELTPGISGIIRKAAEEARAAAAAARERVRLALLKSRSKSKPTRLANAAKTADDDGKRTGRKTIVIDVSGSKAAGVKNAALGHRKSRDARVKVASAKE